MRRVIIIVIPFLLMLSCDTSRNTPDPVDHFFVRYYGADGNQEGVDMVANEDGTFMLLGTSTIGSQSQIYLTKVNSWGGVIWERFYGDTATVMAKDIELTVDGNYIVLADLVTDTTGTDILLLAIDADGSQLKSGIFSYDLEYDDVETDNDFGITVTQITDAGAAAGFIVAGNTNHDPNPSDSGEDGFKGITALFIRFDNDLNVLDDGLWSKSHGSIGDDFATRVVQVKNDLSDPTPFKLFGYTNSAPPSSFDYWITSMNNGGTGLNLETGVEWPTSTDEFLGSVTLKSSSALKNFLLTGVTSGGLIFIATTDLAISPQSIPQINLGVISNPQSKNIKVSASTTNNADYLIVANMIVSGHSDIVLTSIDGDGTPLWDNPVILGGAGDDFGSAVHELPDGRILVFGTMQIGDEAQSKMVLMKMNSKGRFND
jgi:hypothetical protein